MLEIVRLPALRKNGKVIASGILDVLRFFKSQDITLSTVDPARDTILSTYISETMQPISLYIQRLHVLHFQYIFRPGFLALLPPSLTKYAASMLMIKDSKYRISHVYNIDLAETPENAKRQQLGSEDSVPGFSFFKKQTIKYGAVNKDVPESVVEKVKQAIGGGSAVIGRGGAEEFGAVMRMLSVAMETFPAIEDALDVDPYAYLFDETPSTADIFLLAHLFVQCVPMYSVPFVNELIDGRFPKMKKYLEAHRDILTLFDDKKSECAVPIDADDELNVRNIIRFYTGF